jgi:hypothetical protein
MFVNTTTQHLSLAAIQAGDTFEVLPSFALSGTAFGRGRSLAAGARFFCRAAGAATILLVNDDRRTISVPRDVARFIPVRRTHV